MILTPRCSLIFFTLLGIKRKINTERKILLVLTTLQMSALFSYKLGFAAILATAIVSFDTVIFIIFHQTNQIAALQETLHTLCTEALLDHA